jgi:hypothetical protein
MSLLRQQGFKTLTTKSVTQYDLPTLRSLNVIASEAKQSILRHKERMDCFVASAPRNDVDRPSTLDQARISALIMSAAFSPIMMVGALVLPPIRVGITEASTTRRPSSPWTFSLASTTAIASLPIRAVPTG